MNQPHDRAQRERALSRDACWQSVTTVDGITVQGCRLDGWHVTQGGVLLASYYRGPAGQSALAALDHFRAERAAREEATPNLD